MHILVRVPFSNLSLDFLCYIVNVLTEILTGETVSKIKSTCLNVEISETTDFNNSFASNYLLYRSVFFTPIGSIYLSISCNDICASK